MIFIAILTGISIVLGMSYSNFIVTSENHKVAEMYIGTLKYSMTIDGSTTNTLSVPSGETIVDVTITNENPIDTYYKLIYQNNSNVSIKYYESTKDTNDNVTNYSSPNDKITSNNTNTIKLKITNSSTSSQKVTFKIVGGFATNTLDDVTVPTGYTIIGKDTSTNTYFCTTTDTLTQGLQYVNGQYTYAYKQEGDYASSGLAWYNISNNGWGVQLTDKTSTDIVTSKVCTYINNKPVVSMSYMFYNSQATTLDVSNFNTSKVTYMNLMFYNSQATTLDVSNFDTSKVTKMNSMFYNSQATTLDVSTFDTSNVTDMSFMFYNSKATTLDVSNFNTSKVTYMNGMFYESQATTLDVSNFNTSKVTDMNFMFYGSQATTLDVSNFDTSKVTDMRYMFYGSQATILDVSNFNTSKVTDMRHMFQHSQATTLDVSTFDTSNVTDMSYMFSDSKATTLDVSNFDTSKVTDMRYMFYGSQATILDVSNFDTSNVTNMSYMFYNSQATTLDVSNFNTSKVTNMSGMFWNSQATTLDVSNFNTSKVTDMGAMFYNSQATTLDVSNFDTSKVTDMRYMFEDSQATTLDVSSFDTSKVTDMSYMFDNSTNLKTIYVSDKFLTIAVTSSTGMFRYCTNLVGGAGTKYNSSYVDKTYARIDGGTSNPGYFTSIPEPNSFSSDSWMTIAKAVKSGNISKYNVGNTKTVNLGTYGTHTLRIANTSTPSECSTTGFSQTACGFVLEFADIITEHNMNDTKTNVGGWPATTMRTFVNNDIYNSLPSELKNAIIDTTVVSGHGSTSGETNFTSTDKLYLLSTAEVWAQGSSNKINYDTARDNTRQLDYYKNLGVTTSNYSGTIKKNGTSASDWWLRAAISGNTDSFLPVGNNGDWYNYSANFSCGVAPAFRIG